MIEGGPGRSTLSVRKSHHLYIVYINLGDFRARARVLWRTDFFCNEFLGARCFNVFVVWGLFFVRVPSSGG